MSDDRLGQDPLKRDPKDAVPKDEEADGLELRAREALPKSTVDKLLRESRDRLREILQYDVEVITPERFPGVLPALLKAEGECYPEPMRDGQENLRWIADKGSFLTLTLRGEVAGYVSSVQAALLEEDYFGDKNMNKEYLRPDVLYVCNVSIVPRHQNKSLFTGILYPATIREAVRRGYKKIVFHSRRSENLTDLYTTKYDAKVVGEVKNWFPELPEELFDIIEIDLNPEKNPKIAEVLSLRLPSSL